MHCFDAACRFVTDWRVAIDGGAYVGDWSARMAKCFQRVIAFEPVEDSFEALLANVSALPNVECRMEALLNFEGRVDMLLTRPKRPATSRFAEPSKRGAIRCVAIDDIGLESCGLIKLDLEGAELQAFYGAIMTIKRFKPVIVAEIGGLSKRYGATPKEVAEFVKGLGYKERARIGVDRVFVPMGRP